MSRQARRNRREPQVEAEPQHLSLVPDRPVFVPPGPLKAKTAAQRSYICAIKTHSVVLATGPAGVGKTYVSLSTAAEMLASKDIEKLYLVRPLVVACEEEVGFLPGDLQAKVDPFFMPTIDILHERLGKTFTDYLIKNGRLVMSPLAFMRGVTLKDCFVLVTEAQNMSVPQMKLLLTRLGTNVKCVLEGDLSQSDARGAKGLEDALDRLADVGEVTQVEFTRSDVVRSGLCQEIVRLYED